MKLKGSATIEMAFVMPVILLAFTAVVYIGFFFHDKNVLQALVYEGLVIGSSSYRMEAEVDTEVVETFIREKAELRMIYFSLSELEVEVEAEEILVKAIGINGKLELNIERKLALTEPETMVRSTEILTQWLE